MTDDSKSFEKRLDKDFLVFLNLTKGLFDNIQNESQRSICEVWLTLLLGKTVCSISEKCNRNIFLSRLLLQMQSGRLKGVFLDTPPNGTLPCAFSTFALPAEVDGLKGFEEMGFQVDTSVGGDSGDVLESSRDGRTYLATRRLPEGIMAYMAVTNNEGEEIWVPQQCAAGQSGLQGSDGASTGESGRFMTRLGQIVGTPISQLRRSPEDREKTLDWMDKMINACNSWLQGEDPHNMELEALFEMLYEDYRCDPEKAEILKHPKIVRNVLFQDIRDMISERRMEIAKRELVLDQYEADEYVEEAECDALDEVWLECAKKPLNDKIKNELDSVYPPEVVQRFSELLFPERIAIIQKGEREANKKISDLRSGSLDEIKKEFMRLKRVQDEYKMYYSIYEDVEAKAKEFEKEYKDKCSTKGEVTGEQDKREIEMEIDLAKQRFERERRRQNEMEEKLEEAKEAYMRAKDKMAQEAERLNCERSKLETQKEELLHQIASLRNKKDELKMKLTMRRTNCPRYK